ncbi:methyltransferase family protein [Gimesia aquarii]|uniref:methyltransferase family protein n=1 Tax=Gimesia aquarii TaxID=2527964 RepID=UPI0018D7740A|nr:isoprenylcysteine carboxylmethyltransferase family protein [Gimesia aquarii]
MSPALVGLAVVGTTVFFAILLFVPAGRLDWILGWIYVGLFIINMIINWVCLQLWNPELIAARMRFSKGTKTWDKVWAALFAPLIIAIYIVAGLEFRDGASRLTEMAWPFGLVLFVLGSALLMWSMVVNPFFEKTVRIQTDRGHRVIDSGPYAYLRHPGYVGFMAWVLSTPLLLASAWALIPALLSVIGIAIRTALEDRTLRAELPGYTDYTKRVRFRLIPGIW